MTSSILLLRCLIPEVEKIKSQISLSELWLEGETTNKRAVTE